MDIALLILTSPLCLFSAVVIVMLKIGCDRIKNRNFKGLVFPIWNILILVHSIKLSIRIINHELEFQECERNKLEPIPGDFGSLAASICHSIDGPGSLLLLTDVAPFFLTGIVFLILGGKRLRKEIVASRENNTEPQNTKSHKLLIAYALFLIVFAFIS